MLKGELSDGFLARPILPLSRILLHTLVGHEEARVGAAPNHAEAIGVGELSFEVHPDILPGAAVCKVFFNWGVEVSIRVREIGADTQRVRSPSILAHRVAACGAEAAGRSHEAAVEATASLSRCDDLDNAFELPSVLGRIPCGQN